MMKRAFILAVLTASLALAGLAATVMPAGAATVPARLTALRWAETQAGKPYCYGGTGPGCYDCSGLVMIAYRHAGISLPRTTEEMLADGRQLVRISRADARWGDLAFYGTGHVELYMGPANWTFGAHASGQAIGRIVFGPAWHPTAYYRVR